MPEKSPNGTSEYEIPPEANKGRVYKEINGVRFEEGVSDEKISGFLGRLENIEQKGLGIGFSEDIRCNLEHANAGSTAPIVREPLKPYALISGKITLEEVKEKMREKGRKGMNLHENYTLRELKEQNFSRRRIPLEISNENLEMLVAYLQGLYSGQLSEDEPIEFIFEGEELDDEGQYVLPHLSHIWVGSERVDFPEKLKQIQVREALAFMPGSIFVVDQKGWRVNKEGHAK